MGLQCAAAVGRDIYVNPETGDERSSGLAPEKKGAAGPVKTMHRAIRMALAGDTVHLAPLATAYREVAVFHNAHGEPGRPIIFDAHGATITGAEPLNPDDCREISPGLYRTDRLIPAKLVTPEDAVSRRWFFLYAGRINRMGRTLKGKNAPYKKPAELAIGEWTYQRDENAFYLKIDPQKTLADYRIQYPARGAGVQVSGDCAHLVIRNLVAMHVYNDGFNIHGKTRDVRYENIQSIECGDDGFSAHDDCDSVIDGFISIGNSTAIANAGRCSTTNNRVFADKNVGTDLLFLGSGVHTLTNSHIRCAGAYSLRLYGADAYDNVCTLKLENVLLERAGETSPLRIDHNGALEADHVTLLGLSLQAAGKSVTLRHSAVGGQPPPEWTLSAATLWTADHNLYDMKLLQIGNTSYDQPVFSTYQKITRQDAGSRWAKFHYPPGTADEPAWAIPGAGCDPAKLPTAHVKHVP
ncbi:MAG TPA: hypothetical protein VIK18_14550 [Pirellulales bacterium]